MFKTRIENFFLRRPIQISEDIKKHRKEVLISFLVAFHYSIFYGIFEYTVMYTRPGLVAKGIISPYINWLFMYTSLIILMTVVTKGRIELVILGMIFFLVFEDLIYHICYGIDIRAYPFPVYDWWDDYLASFRILGRLGQAVPFPPYAPLYYFPGFSINIVQYIVGFVNPKVFRIINWFIEPFLVAIIVGLLWNNDIFALISIIIVPIISYCFILTLFVLKRKGRMTITKEEKFESREEL